MVILTPLVVLVLNIIFKNIVLHYTVGKSHIGLFLCQIPINLYLRLVSCDGIGSPVELPDRFWDLSMGRSLRGRVVLPEPFKFD